MTRTVAREIAVHMVFELGFGNRSAQELLDDALTPECFALIGAEEPLYASFPDETQCSYIRTLVTGAFEHGAELDDYISRYAVGWSFARIPRVAAAIMRVTMYEILYMPDIPNKVAISEAVEIAKRYENEDVVRFINANLTRELPLDYIADHFFISKFYLSRVFKRHMNTTPHSYITQRRLAMAKRLLYDGLSPTEVYRRCGFADYYRCI